MEALDNLYYDNHLIILLPFFPWLAGNIVAFAIPMGRLWTISFSFMMVFITLAIGMVIMFLLVNYLYGWRNNLEIFYTDPYGLFLTYAELSLEYVGVFGIPVGVFSFLYYREKRKLKTAS